MRPLLALCPIVVALLAGCPSDPVVLDGGHEPDASVGEDAGPVPDAGDAVDAGPVDAGAPCGNGVLDEGEACDPAIPSGAGRCPESCPSDDACSPRTLTGSAGECSARCVPAPITACIAGDACCAPGCHANNDADCTPSCGNNVVESGERCDGNCPAFCNDGSACTTDVLDVPSNACSATCVFTAVSACTGGDGCCAAGCNAQNDTDCSASCGNRVVEAGELCDGNCPTACDDGNACTTDRLEGAGSSCSAVCRTTTITACTGGDGCCAPGCNANNDNDCSASCGNGQVEASETCDGNCPATCNDSNACTVDTLTGSASGCSAACSFTQLTQCRSADGCCALGCTAANDTDCVPTKRVGEPCVAAGECITDACIDEANNGWPGGYCTAACEGNADCGSNLHCGFKEDGAGYCLRNCATHGDCRAGYACADLDFDGARECVPTANGSGAVGDACDGFEDCSGGTYGFCIQNTSFKNGACSVVCGTGAGPCPTGSHCGVVDAATGRGACLKDCTSDTNCRVDGYKCRPADEVAGNECWPSATGAAQVGDECAEVWECAGGVDGYCIGEDQGYNNGYCTLECDATRTCPAGSHCAFSEDGSGVCLRTCTNASRCRTDGYACYQVDNAGPLECALSSTGTKGVGEACAGRWECAGGLNGRCFTTWPGGYCSLLCGAGQATCPGGTECINIDPAAGTLVCLDLCNATTDTCRAGLECADIGGSSSSECVDLAN